MSRGSEIESGVCVDCESNGKTKETVFSVDDIMCEFNAGEDKIVNTTLESSYRVFKLSDKKFKVHVNPLFYAKPLVENENQLSFSKRSKREQKKYTDKMNNCFKVFAPFLKGPSGETLEIKAIEDKKITPFAIMIHESGYRSRADHYEEDLDCATILHETLHILGLADEYPETTFGYIMDRATGEYKFVEKGAEFVGFDCRAEGVKNSIMYSEDAALMSVLDLKEYDKTTCICTKDKKECEKLIFANLEKIKTQNKCPQGLDIQSTKGQKMSDEDLKKYMGYSAYDVELNNDINESDTDLEVRISNNGYTEFDLKPISISKKIKPARNSLLMPAHFKFITNPYCNKKNKEYLDCSAGAYKNSKVHGSCSETTKKCQSNTDWLK